MKTPCECPVDGYCTRHGMNKLGRLRELCQTDPRYFNKWEAQARGLPISRKAKSRLKARDPVDGPGTELHDLIKRRGYIVRQGCGCQDRIKQMNRWGVTECRRRVDEICGWLEQSAKKAGWFSKLAMSSPITRDVARRKIKELVTDAIGRADEKSRPLQFASKPLPKNTAIVTFHWNVAGYRRLRDTYFEWLPTVGYPVQCIELVFGDRQPEIPGSTVIRGGLRNAMWQKERLINSAVSKLPAEVENVVWIDHDFCFESEDWLELAIRELADCSAVQPFQKVRYTDLAGNNQHVMRSACSSIPGPWHNTNPGGVWVARRELFDRGGLYDRCIVGGGDSVWFTALTGLRRKMLQEFGLRQRTHAEGYFRTMGHQDINHLPGTMRHLWHGEQKNRQHKKRVMALAKSDFDPERHVEVDDQGLLAWTQEAPKELMRYVSQFFLGRAEDG